MDDIVYERVSHPDECTCLICLMGAEIERLRKEVDIKGYRLDDALDEIERLRTEVARLGAFLHPIGEEARRG